MRKHVLPFLILLAIVAGVLYFLLNSPWLLSKIIPSMAAKYLPAFPLQTFTIGDQEYKAPDTIVLKNVKALVKYKNGLWDEFLAEEVTIYDFFAIPKLPHKFRADIRGIRMEGPGRSGEGLTVKILLTAKQGDIARAEGVVYGGPFTWEGYRFDRLQGRIDADYTKIQILEAVVEAYGGEGKGQVLVERTPDPAYIFWFEFSRLRPESLTAVNRGVFSLLQGAIDGSVRLKGRPSRMEFLTITAQLAAGGTVQPELIRNIVRMGDSLGKAEAGFLEGQTAPIVLDKGVFNFQSGQPTQGMATVELSSSQSDFEVKTMHEIRLPQGASQFLMNTAKQDLPAR
ncbi:MAG: hypothetical protein Q8Q08_03120 [Candidatus Omnitrophota bacterium]|nr:hypothetical protein [Candidatus Omnitrophota bacterium]MDZ4243063.1 hypothetical protein [Candidatus Omnitrophota bacterium]